MENNNRPLLDIPQSLQVLLKCYRVFLEAYDKGKKAWRATEADPYFINYVAAWVLYEMGVHEIHDGFRSAQDWFIKSRNNRGLWGGEKEGPELESTARACVALLIDSRQAELDRVKLALEFLVQQQTSQGWWPGEFIQYRANQPYYGAMLPISFALNLALAAKKDDGELIQHIRASQLKLCRFLEQRFDEGNFSSMGVINENPIRALTWGIRIYINASGERTDIKEHVATQLRAILQSTSDFAKFDYQDLYNIIHSLALLKVSLAEPEVARACLELQRRAEKIDFNSSEHTLRYAGGTLLAFLKLWRAHPLSKHYEQFLEPMVKKITTREHIEWQRLLREHWLAIAGLLIAVISAIAAILQLLK